MPPPRDSLYKGSLIWVPDETTGHHRSGMARRGLPDVTNRNTEWPAKLELQINNEPPVASVGPNSCTGLTHAKRKKFLNLKVRLCWVSFI